MAYRTAELCKVASSGMLTKGGNFKISDGIIGLGRREEQGVVDCAVSAAERVGRN
jgi:hypothetical protein